MKRDNTKVEKYIEAKNRVTAVKKYYVDVVRLVIFTILLFLFKGSLLETFENKGLEDAGVLKWMDWNLMILPAIIGVVLLVKGIKLFFIKKNYVKNWEDRQIEKIMGDDTSAK